MQMFLFYALYIKQKVLGARKRLWELLHAIKKVKSLICHLAVKWVVNNTNQRTSMRLESIHLCGVAQIFSQMRDSWGIFTILQCIQNIMDVAANNEN